MADIAHHAEHGWTNPLVRCWRNAREMPLQQTRPRRKALSVLVAATLSSSAYAQVTIPSSTSSVQLQVLSPGSSAFVAPASTVISVFTQDGVVGDNSQNWKITNFGTIRSAVLNAIQLNSADANGVRLDNHGSILGSADYNNPGNGVYLTNGGTVNNYATGSIGSNNFYGILSGAGLLTISNDGNIFGTASGMRMAAGGTITQSQTGTISSNGGVGILNDSGPLTLSNAGSITSNVAPAVLARGSSTGTIANSGLISGVIGVQLANTSGNGVVLTNTGTITGTGGTAVSIGGNNNTLALGTGSTLNGSAVVTAGTNNNLVLQGTGSAGNAFTGFSGLTMSGASWLLSGNVSTTGTTGAATTIQTGILTVAGTLNNGGSGGGTTINSGATLLIGNGGASGSVTGDIVDNGSLGFNRSDTVTYGSVISGTGSVIQQGGGTTVLTAASTYAGGTNLNAGILSVGSDANLGAAAGSLTFNGGTLQGANGFMTGRAVTINTSGTIDTQANGNLFSGVIAGAGTLIKQGSGTLYLAGDNIYIGALVFNRSDSQVYNGIISGSGSVTQVGSGAVIFNGVAGDRLVVSGGTYTANGGRILVDSVLNEGSAASRSDMLVAGATVVGANGATGLSVNNVGGAGLPTIGNGIMVVQVQDPTRSAAGAFTLLGRAVAGPYEYQLFQGGTQNADGNWYLRSEREPPVPPTPPTPPTPPAPLYRPEVAAYLANQRLAGQMFVHSLQDRQGDSTSMDAQNASNGDGRASSAWVRMTGRWEGSNSRDGNFKVDTDSFLLQGGTELAQWKLTREADRLHLGVMAGYASASSDA